MWCYFFYKIKGGGGVVDIFCGWVNLNGIGNVWFWKLWKR